MNRGRPKLPEADRLTHASIRLPKSLIDWYKQYDRSASMREALEVYARAHGYVP